MTIVQPGEKVLCLAGNQKFTLVRLERYPRNLYEWIQNAYLGGWVPESIREKPWVDLHPFTEWEKLWWIGVQPEVAREYQNLTFVGNDWKIGGSNWSWLGVLWFWLELNGSTAISVGTCWELCDVGWNLLEIM